MARSSIIGLLCCIATGVTSVVHADPAPARVDAGFVCVAPFVRPNSGSLSSAAPGLFIDYASGIDLATIRLVQLVGDEERVVSFHVEVMGTTLFLRADEPFIVGEDYVISFPDRCRFGAILSARFHVVEDVITRLGTLAASPEVAANRVRGAEHTFRFVRATVTTDPQFERVRDFYETTLYIDGVGAGPISYAPRDLVVACGVLGDLSEGMHTLEVRASSTFGLPSLVTNRVEVTVTCDGDVPRVNYWTLEPLTDDEVAYWNTVSEGDADAGVSTGTPSPGGSGCSCRVASRPASAAEGSALCAAVCVVLGVSLRRRRRA